MPITPTPETRARLARLMEDRRLELGLRWQDVAEAGGLSLKTLHSVRTGTAGITPLTKRAVAKGLRWAPDSVDRILGGEDPAPDSGTSGGLAPSPEPESRAGDVQLHLVEALDAASHDLRAEIRAEIEAGRTSGFTAAELEVLKVQHWTDEEKAWIIATYRTRRAAQRRTGLRTRIR